jgi:hypothetical protein
MLRPVQETGERSFNMWVENSGRGIAAAAVVAGGFAALGLAAPVSATGLVDQYVEVPQCQPNTSQSCPQEPEVPFTIPDGSKAQPSFTANANHCSDIKVRFLKDNPTTTWYPASDWMQAGPGQTVTGPGLDLSPGNHTLKVQAQGVPGGCNTGHLDAWGGTVHIESTGVSVDAPKPPQLLPNLGDLFGTG